MPSRELSQNMRIYHRYLGFFLAGIMFIYSVSGIILVYRNTNFLKKEKTHTRVLSPNLDASQLGPEIGNRRLEFTKSEGDIDYFTNGTYNHTTGEVDYTTMELPMVLERLTHFHKAKKGDTLYFFNVFFGFCLMFFVISSFFMFMPKSNAMRKGLYWTLGGIVLALIILFSRQ